MRQYIAIVVFIISLVIWLGATFMDDLNIYDNTAVQWASGILCIVALIVSFIPSRK